ncbi:unnamed protein product [Rotaria sp. Silwood1]|nr:unnamed protein product [Rotaria sp. Silwood1]
MKCHKCLSVFQDPFQLVCGHRQCRSCIDKQEGTMIHCIDCQEETPRENYGSIVVSRKNWSSLTGQTCLKIHR